MNDKTARKFEKLRTAYREAREARKAASQATREVKAMSGEALTLATLGSRAGAKAVEAELSALRDERRALKRLAAYASRHAADARPEASGGAEPSTKESKKPGRRKAAKAGKAATLAHAAKTTTKDRAKNRDKSGQADGKD
jgi:hypothetical protein